MSLRHLCQHYNGFSVKACKHTCSNHPRFSTESAKLELCTGIEGLLLMKIGNKYRIYLIA